MRSIIIGTAGHIDHGKTALVKALTGVDTDRLPEEKTRGITIDIGFAHRMLGETQISFIDVPGHERFVRNMLAGIGGIDLLMLVVAADESVMPQTREHFDICRLLNISSGVIVITKRDLVDEDTLKLVQEEMRDLVKGSFLEEAPSYSVSSKTGEGLQSLTDGLAHLIGKVRPRRPHGMFRMPIDRVFVLKGHGTVVTGTLLSGKIRKESGAEILPSHIKTRIRSIHAHDEPVEEALAGQRTALNLQGLEKEQIQRGDVLTLPDVFENTSLLDVKILLLPNSKPVVHNSMVRFHHLTTDTPARITLLEGDVLNPGESGFAQIRLQKPVFALYGDHFILRKHSPLITIGGGVILDHMPARRLKRGESQAAPRLRALETADAGSRFAAAVQERGRMGAEESYLKAKLAMESAGILSPAASGIVFLRREPLLAMEAETLRAVIREMQGLLKEFHRKNPLLPGLAKEEMRSRSFARIPSEVFSAILERAVAEKELQVQKEVVGLFGRSVTLSRAEEDFSARIEEGLLCYGLKFPQLEKWADEIKSSPEAIKKILYLLVRQEKVIKIEECYFLHHKTWEDLKQKIRLLKATRKTFSVPDFKTLFGVSRKYAIPLLERLDREGVTRRSGNERIIM